jgi:hypothetical protein
MFRLMSSAKRRVALALALATAGAAGIAGVLRASDHQDTPLVEIAQLPDINDVYAFPGATPDRIVLAVTTASPITPAQSPTIGFDPNLLYQIKVDNNGDQKEDLVFQLQFRGKGHNQEVLLYGPYAPAQVGSKNTLVGGKPTLGGRTNVALGSATGIQLQAGLFDDPFFIDLQRFFAIIPDRRPSRGPLSVIQPPANSFRNPGIDFLRGFNALGIVIELPEDMLLPANAGADPVLGVWATTSR